MTDRIVEMEVTDIPEIDETLEKAMLYVIDQAREKLEAGEEVVPFTALIVKDKLFLETHPGETVEQCYQAARHTVQNAAGAVAYVFCYDGYVDTDAGTKDAIIAEGGLPGEEDGVAVGLIYDQKGEAFEFVDEVAYVGPAPNFMAFLLNEEADEDADEMYDDAPSSDEE